MEDTKQVIVRIGEQFFGIDISDEYCQLANERLAKHQQESRLFQD